MYGTKIICSKTKRLLLEAELGDSQQNSEQPLESSTAEIWSRLPSHQVHWQSLWCLLSFVALCLLLPFPDSPPVCAPLWLWWQIPRLEKGLTATADPHGSAVIPFKISWASCVPQSWTSAAVPWERPFCILLHPALGNFIVCSGNTSVSPCKFI